MNCASLWEATVSMRERTAPWKQDYVPCETGCRSTKSLRLQALKNVRWPVSSGLRGVPRSAGRAAELLSVTTRTGVGSTMQVTSHQTPAHHRTYGSTPMLIWGAWSAST